MTLYVNLYGGPGTGKSTTAALTFGKLKESGVNAEMVPEFAKDVVWEERKVIACQPYLFGKQLWRLQRLEGKVDVVVTDAPLLLSLIYAAGMGPAWKQVVLEQYGLMDNYDVFLERDNINHPYNPEGRYQKKVSEAEAVDNQIKDMLRDNQIGIDRLGVLGASDEIVHTVIRKLSI